LLLIKAIKQGQGNRIAVQGRSRHWPIVERLEWVSKLDRINHRAQAIATRLQNRAQSKRLCLSLL
jgi:hypothetical protein